MIQNAQVAAQNFPIPQNTQMAHDIPDTETSIQDILNELNISSGQPTLSQPQHFMHPMPPTPPLYENTMMMGNSPLLNPMDPSIMSDFASMAGPVHFQQQFESDQQTDDAKSKYMSVFLSWNKDIKVAIYAIGVFILVSIIPIEKYVYNYIALEKIPYSQVIIKAVLSGIILVVLLHLNH
jgi:hypothetical protein